MISGDLRKHQRRTFPIKKRIRPELFLGRKIVEKWVLLMTKKKITYIKN